MAIPKEKETYDQINKLTNDESKLIRDAIWFYHDQH